MSRNIWAIGWWGAHLYTAPVFIHTEGDKNNVKGRVKIPKDSTLFGCDFTLVHGNYIHVFGKRAQKGMKKSGVAPEEQE